VSGSGEQPCACGSGKKARKCCDRPTRWATSHAGILADGSSIEVHGVTASMDVVAFPPLPLELFQLARLARDAATDPTATYLATLQCVVLAAAAAEAAVNVLLQPLLSESEWNGEGKRRGFSWESPKRKWLRLSRVIPTDPLLELHTGPFAPVAALLDLRNSVMHFRIEHHMQRLSVPLTPPVFDKGHLTLVGAPEHEIRRAMGTLAGLPDELSVQKAPGYFAAVADLFVFVLEHLDLGHQDRYGMGRALLHAALSDKHPPAAHDGEKEAPATMASSGDRKNG